MESNTNNPGRVSPAGFITWLKDIFAIGKADEDEPDLWAEGEEWEAWNA